jgi:DNA (cytosine-5)-methyltransferase 1
LFSGCGGLSLGFEKSGMDIVAAFEYWDAAINVYKENFSHPIFKQDITNESSTIAQIQEFSPDLIMGGPPCQDFSSAGKRDVTRGRADLTYSYANIVCAIKPNWFVMENVERIKKSHILTDVLSQFIDAGYGLSSVILDASYCGVPQARTRFFLIGHLDDQHNKLVGTLKNALAEFPMTLRDYFGDSLGLDFYYRHPRNYNRRGIFSVDEPSPTVRGVNRPIPKGYQINTCDPKGVKLEEIRPLTTIERSYIQTFPKTFKWLGSKTDLEQMIGNAVPVNLGFFIAKAIKTYCQEGSCQQSLLDDVDNFFELPTKVLSKF